MVGPQDFLGEGSCFRLLPEAMRSAARSYCHIVDARIKFELGEEEWVVREPLAACIEPKK